MRDIVVNTLLFFVWLVLTAVLVRGIAWAGETYLLEGWQAFGLWMVGQFVILLPLTAFLWRHRRYEWERH
jgi:hypothetical protein